jgi:hypothetical protein
MKKIKPDLLFVNNRIDINRIEKDLGKSFSQKAKNLIEVSTSFSSEPHFPHNRSGQTDVWKLQTLPVHQIPSIDIVRDLKLNFSEITDRRATEIENYMEMTGLPITVSWSGGIDSTTVVSAMIKNFKTASLKNITILMNNSSYFENPIFFDQIIKPNFKYQNINEYPSNRWDFGIMIDGQPADQIWIQASVVKMESLKKGSGKYNFYTNPDLLLAYLTDQLGVNLANWYYQFVIENIQQYCPVEINTYEDFFWWINFNFYLSGNSLKSYFLNTNNFDQNSFNKFFNNYVPWFLTDDYQRWSMLNNSNGVKINGTVASYKEPAKKYIFEIDKNPYYYHYKTKCGSFNEHDFNLFSHSKNKHFGSNYKIYDILALYDDGTVIRSSDIDQYYEFLSNNQELWY